MELRKISKDKKAMGIGDIYPIILIIATVAILLAILLMVLTEWQGATNTETYTTVNETITGAELTSGGDSFKVDNTTACGADNFRLGYVTNATAGTNMESANYTFNDEGIFTNLTSDIFILGGANITYSFNYGGEDCLAVADVVDDFTDFVPWIGIILLVIAAAIVLGIVINSFRNRRV